MSHPVLVAVPGVAETQLVRSLESSRQVQVVHRCVDLAELLALAGTGSAVAAFVGVDLPRLDLDAIARLRHDGVVPIGVHSRDPADGPPRPSGLGFCGTVTVGAEPAELVAAIESAIAAAQSAPTLAGDPGSELDGHRNDLETDGLPGWLTGRAVDSTAPGRGSLVAVWGPAGAPGRTTVAVTLAGELAERGRSVVLADADTYGAAIAPLLGILDEAPGLAAACRAAAAGTLDLVGLARLAPLVSARLRVLTGITRADRWPELSGPTLEQVLRVSRALADWTIVDVGFCLEQDEELSYDTYAPRRNAATLVALEQADAVVVVGAADPIGLQRLIRGLSDLAHLGVTPAHVVVTKAREAAVGGPPGRRVSEALRRYAGVERVLIVPDDRPSLDAAALAGRSLTEQAPDSPARLVLAELATELAAELPTGAASSASTAATARARGT